ncbi:MAG: hypothetical protein EOM85_04125, partial [Candidatus Moranbacteria bacterium]|nr:hypothetical protein [Candidatus Moranbacteria bacterium]
MITADLVSYIRKQLENDVSSDLIVSKLEKVGWLREDIDEGFEKVREQKEREDRITQNTPVKKNNEDSSSIEPSLGDRYREPIDLDAEPLAKKEIPVIEKKKNIIDDKTKIEVNIGILDSKMELVKNEIKTEDKSVLVENNLTEKRTEIISEPKEPVVEPILDDKEIEAPRREDKIWLPKNIPVKEISARDDNEKDQIVVQNIELPQASKEEKADLALVKEEIRPVEIKMEETAPIVKVDEINLINREAQSLLDAQAEVMRSKITGNISEDIKELPKEEKELPKNYNLENLPKIASISTYPNDMINAVNQIEQSGGVIKKPVNKKMIKWLIGIFVVVILGGLSAWLIMTGQINLKNINIPFINKDPRALILDNSKILSSLNSYKTET